MSSPPSDSPLRAGLHSQWSAAAPRWDDNAGFVDVRAHPVTDRMLERSGLRPNDRVLELACGPGGLGIAAAARVPDGEVVLSDVAPEMTEIAARRARVLGLDNVRTRTLDLEQIDESDDTFDVVLCRDGIMFALEPARALREISRVLRMGGRVSLAVWGPRDANPWLAAVLDAVGHHLGMEIPPPGIPGPFSLSDSGVLAALLRDAAFESVTVEAVDVPFRADSVAQWLTTVPALAGPVASLLAGLPSEAVGAIRAEAESAVGAYVGPTGVDIPGVALVASGRIAA